MRSASALHAILVSVAVFTGFGYALIFAAQSSGEKPAASPVYAQVALTPIMPVCMDWTRSP